MSFKKNPESCLSWSIYSDWSSEECILGNGDLSHWTMKYKRNGLCLPSALFPWYWRGWLVEEHLECEESGLVKGENSCMEKPTPSSSPFSGAARASIPNSKPWRTTANKLCLP